MKKRFYKFLAIFLSLLCITCQNAIADTYEDINASVSYSVKEGRIEVTGTTYGNTVITILPAESQLPSLSDSNIPVVLKQVTSFGYFTSGIIMPDNVEGGKYRVYVSTSYGEDTADFVYINLSVANEIIKDINDATTVGEVERLICTNATEIGIDSADAVFMANKTSFANMLMRKDYADAIDFSDTYFSIYPLLAFRTATPEGLALILRQHEKRLGIDYNADIVQENRLSAEEKTALYTLLGGYDYESEFGLSNSPTFKEVLFAYKSVAAVSAADNWVKLKNVITDTFKENFAEELENQTYVELADKDKVFEIMMQSTYETPEEIKMGFEAAVFEQYDAEHPKVKPSASSYQGGSSGGGGFVAPQEITKPQPDSLKVYFSDVNEDFWGYSAIDELASSGVISGYGDGSFKPNKEITRAEFTKIIVSVIDVYEKNMPDTEHEAMDFSDVNENDWFFSSVKKAFESEIIMGSGNNFLPNSFIKREDAALIIYRLMDKLGNTPSGIKAFADRNNISDYAKDAVSALGSIGVIAGSGNNMFFPGNTLTRAEAAQLIFNALIK